VSEVQVPEVEVPITNAAPESTDAAKTTDTPKASSVILSADDTESTEQVWAPDPADPVKNQEVVAPVKVNLELLDRLMNLVSEMVLARNRLLPFTNQFSK
jgi:two-component system chemotaxis sensor kinase CheA